MDAVPADFAIEADPLASPQVKRLHGTAQSRRGRTEI